MDGDPQSKGVAFGPGSQASPEAAAASSPTVSIPNADCDDPYWAYDDAECWNCGGEGEVYGCSWDWQCSTYDPGEGTCLCLRPCHICHPPKPTAETAALGALLASAIEAAKAGGTPQSGPTEGESAVPKGDAQPQSASLRSRAIQKGEA